MAGGELSAIGPDLANALNQASDDPQIRQILQQVASHTVSSPQDRAHRTLRRIKSLFMQRQYPGPPE